MSRATILKTLRGLSKAHTIRTEPIPTPGTTTTVRKTDTGISVGEEPEVMLPRLPPERQPEGTTPAGIAFNTPDDLASTHPEVYEAVGATRESKRGGGVDKTLMKMAAATEQSDPSNILSKAMQGEDLNVLAAQAAEADQSLAPILSKARVTVLNNYLEGLGMNPKQRGSTAESLMKSAKAGDGGLGDKLARRRMRMIQDEQIARNNTFDAAQRLTGAVRAGIDDVNVSTRVDSTANLAATKLQALDPTLKTKVANRALGKIQAMTLTGKTAEKVGLGKSVTGASRTTLIQAVGKSVRNVKGLEPDSNWEVNGRKYSELTGQDKLRADKQWEVNLANVLVERLIKDGDRGYLTVKKNVGTAMDRSKFIALSKLKKGEFPEDMNPAVVEDIKAQGFNSPLLANQLGFESPETLVKQYNKWKDKYDSGGWDEWEIKPTRNLTEALKGFKDVERTGATPNFGKATKSNKATDLITAKLDLDEDLKHLKDMTPKNAPIFFDAVNHLQATKWDIDNDILDRIESLATRRHNGITPTARSDDELLGQFQTDVVRREAAREADEAKVVDYDSTISAAKQYKDQGGFHFDNWVDFRGRIGYKSAHVNPQGDPVSRSILTLHDEMKVPTTQQWEDDVVNEMLSYHKATKDMTPNQRLQYWETHKDEFIGIGRNWNDTYNSWSNEVKGKDALPFLKAATELYRKYELGATKSGFMTGLDAVTSQAQMLATAFRDTNLGRYVALTADQADDDLYKLAGRDVWRLMADEAGDPRAAFWLSPTVSQHSRAIMKRPVMTDTYNAGKSTMAEQLIGDAPGFPTPNDRNNPLHFIEQEHADYLIGKLVQVLNDPTTDAGKVFQSVTGIKTATKEAAKELVYDTGRKTIAKSGKEYPILQYSQGPGDAFTSKSGFKFRQHYRSHETGQVKARTIQPNEQGVLAEARGSFGYRLPTIEPRNDTLNSMKTSFAPNTIHNWDADVLHHTVKYLKDDGIPAATVHDQFFVPAGYSEELRAAYVKALKTVFSGDRLREMLSEQIPAKKVDEIMGAAGLNRGDLDLEELDNLLRDYWSKGISPINVG